MKKLFSVLLAFLLLAPLASCGIPAGPVVLPPREYDALRDKHLSDLLTGMILLEGWQDANEVEADLFVYYHLAVSLREDENVTDGWADGYIPAEELETVIQSRFDVTAEHLRTSMFYDAERGAYAVSGLGSVGESTIMEAVVTGNRLSITYDVSGHMDYLEASGTLEMEVDGNILGDSVKFLSNRVEWSAQHALRFPSAMDETDYRGVFMMDSAGQSSASEDGVSYKHYNGGDLGSVIAFYEDEALPALGAEGTADPEKYEDGWYWSGTYRGGIPLVIDVRRRFGADSYVITALHDGTDNAHIADNMRERDFMQPPDLSDFSEMGGYVWPLLTAGLLDTLWNSPEGASLPGLVAFYANSIYYGEGEEPPAAFPPEEVEAYAGRRFGVGAEALRGSAAYDAESGMYRYAPAERADSLRVVSATSYGREEAGPVHVTIAYEVMSAGDEEKILWSGEVAVELSGGGYRYLSHRARGGVPADGGDETETEREYYADLSAEDEALYQILTTERGLREWQIHSLGSMGYTFGEMTELPDSEIARMLAPGASFMGDYMTSEELARLVEGGMTESDANTLMALGYDYASAAALTREQLDFIFPTTELIDHIAAAGYDRDTVYPQSALTMIGGYQTYKDLLDEIFR